MDYEQDVFYKTNFPIKKKKEILYDALEKSQKWWVDNIEKWQRVEIEMSFDEIMGKINEKSHYTLIHRRGFKGLNGEYCFEAGFCTMGENPTYLLWIICPEDTLPYFIDKYHLEIVKT